MFMVISFWADFGRPVLASLLGKTGGGAKTHRCPEDFFFLIDFSGDDYRIYRGFQEHPYRLVHQVDRQLQPTRS
jgi:hypothetical protein